MSATNLTNQLNDAARGLAQQMILWGHDVRHPGGNALIRFGLTRRPSSGLRGTSCYSTPWESGIIELHGAVASWTSPRGGSGCIYCRDRRCISLWHGAVSPVPGDHGLRPAPPRQRWEAFQPLLRWLITYESWVASHLSDDWRERTWKAIRHLPSGKQWLPPASALAWWKLALDGNPPRPKSLLNPI